MRRAIASLLLSSIAVVGCSDDVPTSVLVRVEIDPLLETPARLKLRVTEQQRGIVVDDRRLPDVGAPVLPSELVLYPPSAQTLGLWLRAYNDAGRQIAQAAERATPVVGQQRVVLLLLRADLLGDGDGDGVPDAIDRCPGIPDPPTGPCGGTDAAVEGGSDADAGDGDVSVDGPSDGPSDGDSSRDGGDASVDTRVDTRSDSTVDLPPMCTGDPDCDDSDACTTDRCVNNSCVYTPVGCPPQTNPCKAARCDKQLGCVVDDEPATKSCDDNQYCTVSDHCDGNGSCVGGGARSCPANDCQLPSCNESQNRCETQDKADGTFCDDGQSCTQGEQCQSGSCTAPSGPVISPIGSQINVVATGQRAVAVDSSGRVHAVYSNGSVLRYGTRAPTAGATFNTFVVSGFPAGSGFDWPSIAIDGNDTLHLVFHDENDGRIRYGRLPSGATSFQAITTLPSPANAWVALAIRGGTVHVVYVSGRGLRYAQRSITSTGAFAEQQVSPPPTNSGETAMWPSLAIDAQGAVHVAYGEGSTSATVSTGSFADDLYYATNRTGSWVVTTPASINGDHGSWTAIAVSSSGAVAIAHSSYRIGAPAQSSLYVTAKPSPTGSFSDTQVDSSGVSHKSMVMDSSGRLHILYRRFGQSPDELRYATNAMGGGSGFSIATIDAQPETGRWISMTRAPNGQLHGVFEVNTSVNPGASNPFRHVAFSACP